MLVSSAKLNINTGAAVTGGKFISTKILSTDYKDRSGIRFR